jgi:ATP-dependent Clp protease protease subunit
LAEAAFFTEKAREAKANADKAEIELSEFKALALEQSTSDSRNRIINFGTDVSRDSISEVRDQVSKWVRQDPKAAVTIIFNSPGGEVIDGLALFDYLRGVARRGTPVVTACSGMAASMAGVLLQAGSKRIVNPNAYFMMHQVASGGGRQVKSLEQQQQATAWLDRLNDRLVSILAASGRLKAADLKKRIKSGEWILDAEDTVKYGLADVIEET